MDERALRRMANEHDDPASRRSFLRRATIAGAAVTIGAATVPMASVMRAGALETTPALPESDIELVRFAESIEIGLAELYHALTGKLRGLSSLGQTGGTLGSPGSALAEILALFGRHHADHGSALAKLAIDAEGNDRKFGKANSALVDAVSPKIESATTQSAILSLAYSLEEQVAATYQAVMNIFDTSVAAGTAATIQPVESQHAVVLGQQLGLPTSQYLPAEQLPAGGFDLSTYAIS